MYALELYFALVYCTAPVPVLLGKVWRHIIKHATNIFYCAWLPVQYIPYIILAYHTYSTVHKLYLYYNYNRQ
jgi:hypothetical protein